MSVQLQLKATGASGTKTWTITNPVAPESFNSNDAKTYVNDYGDLYGSDLSLATAVYIETSETTVYPAA